jgi:hypothetical protein
MEDAQSFTDIGWSSNKLVLPNDRRDKKHAIGFATNNGALTFGWTPDGGTTVYPIQVWDATTAADTHYHDDRVPRNCQLVLVRGAGNTVTGHHYSDDHKLRNNSGGIG